jgi:predicted Zn finger-like uncharacterized protein
MSVRVVCPHCQSRYLLADGLRGKRVVCRSCETPFVAEADLMLGEEDAIREENVPIGPGTAALPRAVAGEKTEFRKPPDHGRPRRLVLLLAVTGAAGVVLGVLLTLGAQQLVPPRARSQGPFQVVRSPRPAPYIVTARSPAHLPLWKEPPVLPPEADPQSQPAKDPIGEPPGDQP